MPWLRAITQRRAIDALRRGARRPHEVHDPLAYETHSDTLAGPGDGLENRDRDRQLAAAVAKLPEGQREGGGAPRLARVVSGRHFGADRAHQRGVEGKPASRIEVPPGPRSFRIKTAEATEYDIHGRLIDDRSANYSQSWARVRCTPARCKKDFASTDAGPEGRGAESETFNVAVCLSCRTAGHGSIADDVHRKFGHPPKPRVGARRQGRTL